MEETFYNIILLLTFFARESYKFLRAAALEKTVAVKDRSDATPQKMVQ